MKPWIAAGLIILPLLIAGLVAYWPSEHIAVSSVIIPPADVHSNNDVSDLAGEVPLALARELQRIPELKVETANTHIDPDTAARFDAVVITTLTEDAGIIRLNVQTINPGTRREIWNQAYQSSRSDFRQMLRVAAEGVRTALD